VPHGVDLGLGRRDHAEEPDVLRGRRDAVVGEVVARVRRLDERGRQELEALPVRESQFSTVRCLRKAIESRRCPRRTQR